MSAISTEGEAAEHPGAFAILKGSLLPFVREKGSTYQGWLERWWQPWRPRREFLDAIARSGLRRIIACSRVASRPIYFFISGHGIVPLERLQLFAFSDDYSFGVLQSSHHWSWAIAKGGRREERIEYATAVWRTFPWPQGASSDQVAAVATAARELRRVRANLMEHNNWSLRALYQAGEVEGAHPLKDAQAALDVAVDDAYGIPEGQGHTEFLLQLNQLVSEDEQLGRTIAGPGLPLHLNPNDLRWTSTDCIEPPSVEN